MPVISASRRTDIPAFYSSWFMNRIRAGFCHWLNPYFQRVHRASLAPEDVIALVFWTRNPAPLLRHLPELDARGYRYIFQYTVVGYGRPLETHNPSLQSALRTFRTVAERIGPERVVWRYDPIVISSDTPPEYHVQQFEAIARALAGYTQRCKYSFVDLYSKTRRNLAQLTQTHGITFYELAPAERCLLLAQLADVAQTYGIALQSCCEADHEAIPAIQAGGCIDLNDLRAITGDSTLDLKPRPTRALCNCAESTDIGAYDMCLFGCTYCYATRARPAALERHAMHDPEDTILFRPDSWRGIDLDTRLKEQLASAVPAPGHSCPTTCSSSSAQGR